MSGKSGAQYLGWSRHGNIDLCQGQQLFSSSKSGYLTGVYVQAHCSEFPSPNLDKGKQTRWRFCTLNHSLHVVVVLGLNKSVFHRGWPR